MQPLLTLLPDWDEAFAAGMASLDLELPPTFTPDILVSTANAILNGDALPLPDPAAPLAVFAPERRLLPEPKDDAYYTVVVLNALTVEGQTVSLGSSGVVYIDPIIALAAASFCARRPDDPATLPRGTSYAAIHSSTDRFLAAMAGNDPEPSALMQPAPDWIGERPSFHVAALKGEHLATLLRQGAGSVNIGGHLSFVEMFTAAQK